MIAAGGGLWTSLLVRALHDEHVALALDSLSLYLYAYYEIPFASLGRWDRLADGSF